MKKSQNFWLKIKNKKQAILAMAPMAGFTDSAFRQICKDFGADVLYSEMASATALFFNQNAKDNPTLELLKYSKKEKPYVVQLFGNDPKHFAMAAKIVEKEIKPQGIDINFGCPVPKVAKQKAGAELFKDLIRSREVIQATIENTSLPVSIKTRTAAGQVNILKFLDNISDLDIKALMIHGRTLKQGFSGSIDTKVIKKARNYFDGIILANGGINSLEDAEMILKETEADGLGIGRGALGRPWLFEDARYAKVRQRDAKFIFKVILRHAKLVNKLKGDNGIIEMRKHLCWYVQGMEGARALRNEFVKVENLKDVENILSIR